MQCITHPSIILQCVDKLIRNFLWGSSESKKNLHLIGWNKITKPKEEGGLGIQVAKPKNIVLLAKLNWRFHLEKSSLWVRVLSQKYHSQSRSSRNQVNPISCSPTWVAIKKEEAIFKKGSKWIARRVCGLSLWLDKWLEKGTLRSLILGPLNKGKEKKFDSEMLLASLGRIWRIFPTLFRPQSSLRWRPLLPLSQIKERIGSHGTTCLVESSSWKMHTGW